jgi:hypothetical protein
MDRSPVKSNWIREGMTVFSKNWPEIKMVVDSIERKSVEAETIPVHGVPGMSQVLRRHVIGVSTHWINENHEYQWGIFHTLELEEWTDT